jgi:hypothetical protein
VDRTTAKLAFCVLLCLLLSREVSAEPTPTAYRKQAADLNMLQGLAASYRQTHAAYPTADEYGTWFDKLAADNPGLRENLNVKTISGRSLPMDLFGLPIILESPIGPDATAQLAILRCLGANGRDDKGLLDDWDIRYGPNLGYWYKSTWPALYLRTRTCAILALIGLAVMAWFVRPWVWLWFAGATWIGFLAFVIVPVGMGSGVFLPSTSIGPYWFFPVALVGAVLLIVGGVPSLFGIARHIKRRSTRKRRHTMGHCIECDYDLRGTIAARRRSCPECGARIRRFDPLIDGVQ